MFVPDPPREVHDVVCICGAAHPTISKDSFATFLQDDTSLYFIMKKTFRVLGST